MELRAQEVKAEPGIFWVGLTSEQHVFIKEEFNDNDEHHYAQFLKVEAKSVDDAKNIVMAQLVKGEYRVIVDRLWAWR